MIRRGVGKRSSMTWFPICVCLLLLVSIYLNETFVFSDRKRGDGPQLEEPLRNMDEPQSLAPGDRLDLPAGDPASVEEVDAEYDASGSGKDEVHSQDDDSRPAVSPYAMRPWLRYEPLKECPSWTLDAVAAPETSRPAASNQYRSKADSAPPPAPWALLPEPNTPVHVLTGSTCRVPLGPRIRMAYVGKSGKSWDADSDDNGGRDWKEREEARRGIVSQRDTLMEELHLQLRCRIGSIDIELVDDDDPSGLGGENAAGGNATLVMLHVLPSEEVTATGGGLHSAHKIVVGKGTISLWAGTRAGVAYAVASLLSVFLDRVDAQSGQFMRMPAVDTLDPGGPPQLLCGGYDTFDGAALSYRGLMIDVARHFVTVPELVRVMHVMGLLKLNVLHLHLSDDQGWRVEVPGIPELTLYGARRGRNVNPRSSKYARMNIRSYAAEGAFYSLRDLRYLRRVARLLHIAIVPEVDVPAHSAALIRSANALRREPGSRRGHGDEGDGVAATQSPVEHRLDGVIELHEGCVEDACIDSTARGAKACAQLLAVNCMGGTHGLLMPTNKTFGFLKQLLHIVVKQLFPDSSYVHLGGDETAQFTEASVMTEAWRQDLRTTWGVSTLSAGHRQLATALRKSLLSDADRTVIVWDDSIATFDEPLKPIDHVIEGHEYFAAQSPDAPVVQWWRDWHPQARWETIRQTRVFKILSPTTNTYFDASQHKDRTADAFPVQDGQVLLEQVWGLRSLLNNPKEDRVLGIEGCLWSETLTNSSVLWYQLLPRAAALAQVGWTVGGGLVGSTATAEEQATLHERAEALRAAVGDGDLILSGKW